MPGSLLKKGARVFLKERVLRLGIPFFLWYMFFGPLCVFIFRGLFFAGRDFCVRRSPLCLALLCVCLRFLESRFWSLEP